MTNADVIKKFVNGKDGRSLNMRSEDGILYSYKTPIAVKTPFGVAWTTEKFTPTTSRHQALLRYELSNGREIESAILTHVRKMTGIKGMLTGDEEWLYSK